MKLEVSEEDEGVAPQNADQNLAAGEETRVGNLWGLKVSYCCLIISAEFDGASSQVYRDPSAIPAA